MTTFDMAGVWGSHHYVWCLVQLSEFHRILHPIDCTSDKIWCLSADRKVTDTLCACAELSWFLQGWLLCFSDHFAIWATVSLERTEKQLKISMCFQWYMREICSFLLGCFAITELYFLVEIGILKDDILSDLLKFIHKRRNLISDIWNELFLISSLHFSLLFYAHLASKPRATF